MIVFEIPGKKTYRITNILMDLNGTLAVDGIIPEEVYGRLKRLSEKVNIIILTAGTHGKVDEIKTRGLKVTLIEKGKEAERKRDYLEKLGKETCAAIGNGANDYLMMKRSALSIGVIYHEGACKKTMDICDVIVNSPEDALDLFLFPKRMVATLRN